MYLLKSKDDAVESENPLNKKIKVLIGNRDAKYKSLLNFALKMGLYMKPYHLIRLNPME